MIMDKNFNEFKELVCSTVIEPLDLVGAEESDQYAQLAAKLKATSAEYALKVLELYHSWINS